MPQIEIGDELTLRRLSDDALQSLILMAVAERARRNRMKQSSGSRKRMPDQRLRYVSWDEAVEILSTEYPLRTTAEAHASRLWASMYHEVQYLSIQFEGFCGECGMVPHRSEEILSKSHEIGCKSRTMDSAKTLLWSKRSLMSNTQAVQNVKHLTFPDWIKADYALVVEGLRKRG